MAGGCCGAPDVSEPDGRRSGPLRPGRRERMPAARRASGSERAVGRRCIPVGATRPACSSWRSRSPAPTRSRRCTSTTDCGPPPIRTSATAGGRRPSSGSNCPCTGPRLRRRRPATCRHGRAPSATRRPTGWRARATVTSRPAIPRPTRWRRSCTGWRRRRAGGRCSACDRARVGWSDRCWRSRARETAAHCRARGLEWREDETNASGAYARNRIRHALVPALEQAHPAAQANVLALAEILAGEAEVLDALVESVLDGRDEVALSVLRAQPAGAAAADRPAAGRHRGGRAGGGRRAPGRRRRGAPRYGHRIGRPSAPRPGHRHRRHRALDADAAAAHIDSDA